MNSTYRNEKKSLPEDDAGWVCSVCGISDSLFLLSSVLPTLVKDMLVKTSFTRSLASINRSRLCLLPVAFRLPDLDSHDDRPSLLLSPPPPSPPPPLFMPSDGNTVVQVIFLLLLSEFELDEVESSAKVASST